MDINLFVYTEICGTDVLVGTLEGNNTHDTCFRYCEEYLNRDKPRAISISLPLQKEAFGADVTRIFFEGLLPEGFTRRRLHENIRIGEHDFIGLLTALGSECLGAIRIAEPGVEAVKPAYQKLSDKEVILLAGEGADRTVQLMAKSHLSLTGATGKVGLYYHNGSWYLPVGTAPSSHIVKQSHVRLKHIVANEQLCLLTARKLGIEVPESFIVKTDSDRDEMILFATKRYDRAFDENCEKIDGFTVPYRLHQEDFSQALGIAASDKYEQPGGGYLKRMFDLISRYCSDPITDMIKLWKVCIFNYLIGNTDNHVKNNSLLYSPDLSVIRLAPAYDIVSTLVYESGTEIMSVSIGGELDINKVTRDSFENEAMNIGLGRKMAMNIYDSMYQQFPSAIAQAADELSAEGFPYITDIRDRILQRYPH